MLLDWWRDNGSNTDAWAAAARIFCVVPAKLEACAARGVHHAFPNERLAGQAAGENIWGHRHPRVQVRGRATMQKIRISPMNGAERRKIRQNVRKSAVNARSPKDQKVSPAAPGKKSAITNA